MTWTWFTQSSPVSATAVASANDYADLATIDSQVVAAYSPNPDVSLISRINQSTYAEVVLLDREENSSSWGYALDAATGGWRYAVVAPNGSRIELSPDNPQPGRNYTYPVSDAIYAAAYDDFKQKYKSPLLTSDGTSVHRVWLYRYDSADPAGIYPIVWESVDGSTSSAADGSTVLGRSTGTNEVPGPVGPVSIGPVTITSTGKRSGGTEVQEPSSVPAMSPETTVLGIGAAGVLLTAAAGIGFFWFLIHEVSKR